MFDDKGVDEALVLALLVFCDVPSDGAILLGGEDIARVVSEIL